MTIIPRVTPPSRKYAYWTDADDVILVSNYARGWINVNAALRSSGRPERARTAQRQRVCTLRRMGRLHAIDTQLAWVRAGAER